MGIVGITLVGLAIAIGLVGIVLPILPGAFLVLGAIVVWAIVENTATAWTALGLAVAAIGISQVLKYVLPTRRLREGGIPNSTLVIGAIAGIIGFFVVPVIGLPIGFVLGIYLMELQRLGRHNLAYPSTVAALKAVGWSMLIEFVGAVIAALAWLAGVLAT